MVNQYQQYAEEERVKEAKMRSVCKDLTPEQVKAIADWIGATIWHHLGRPSWAMFAVSDVQRNFREIMGNSDGGHLPVQ